MANAIVACHRREAAPNLAPLWYLVTAEIDVDGQRFFERTWKLRFDEYPWRIRR